MLVDDACAKRVMDLIRMDDKDFYDRYLADLCEEEKDEFFKEFPEFAGFQKSMEPTEH